MNPKAFNTGYLPENDGHKVYFEEYGNKKGKKIVSLHGGPGSKSKPKHAGYYNLEKYHVILFDQRGCGKSLPSGEIENNTTTDLITDIECLRVHLDIKDWFVAGGSWGSTLALAYSQIHSTRVNGLLLSAIFLARRSDIDWAFTASGGIDHMFPDLWEERLKFLKQYKTSPRAAAKVILKEINTANETKVKEIVATINNWEGNVMNAQENLMFTNPDDIKDGDIASTKVYLHYEANNFFLKENQLLNNMNKIQSIPAVMVHGRYDLLCPLDQMWDLKKKFKNVEVVILPTSNHKLTADGDVARNYAFRNFLSLQTT